MPDNVIAAKATHRLIPLTAPKEVYAESPPGRRQDGFKPRQSLPLGSLLLEDLDALAQKFITDLYTNAGYADCVIPRLVRADKTDDDNKT